MTKILYIGDSHYLFVGLSAVLNAINSENILWCDVLRSKVTDFALENKIVDNSFTDVIIFNLIEENVFDCAIMARSLSDRSKGKIVAVGSDRHLSMFTAISGYNFTLISKLSSHNDIVRIISTKIQNEKSYKVAIPSKAVTKSELDVLILLMQCYSMNDITKNLGKNRKNISSHRMSIAKKLGFSRWQFMQFIAKSYAYKKYNKIIFDVV